MNVDECGAPLSVPASGCLLLRWLKKKCIKTINSIWNGKNLTQHLCARRIHRIYPTHPIPYTHTHTQLPTQTRFKNILLFFAVFNNSWQCSFICWPHPALILRYRSTHSRRHCLSDADSHAVCPSFYYSLNNELHLSPACPSKTQRSYGRLTRTRQAYNLYWLS